MDTGDILGTLVRGRVALLAMWMGLLLLPVLGHGQSWQWATYANSPLTDRGAGIDVDKRTGDVYVCGSAAGALGEWGLPATTGTDGWVAKFKPNGTLRWAFLLNGAGNAELNDIVVDSTTQRFYVTGTLAGMTTLTGTSGLSANVNSSAGADILVACFDSAGVMQWYAVEGGPGNDLGSGLAVDASGLYLSGGYQTNITLDGAIASATATLTGSGVSDWFAARYNKATGALNWAVGNTTGNNTSRANAIATDPTGTDVYVVGGFSGASQTVVGTSGNLTLLNSNSGNFDMWACALRKSDGLARWGYTAGAASNEDEAFGVTSDAGAVFTTGRCQGNPTFAPLGVQPSGALVDAFAARHNPTNGNALWVNIMGSGGGADLQTVNDINPDGKGNLVISGFFSGSINLPSNASISTTRTSAGGTDLLLACINPAGGLVWSTQAGAAGSMDGSSESCAYDDKMAYVTGAYAAGNSQFATAPVTNLPLAGQEDVLVAKYGLCSLYVNPVNTLSSPVPGICSGGATTVDLLTSQSGASYQLVDSATGLPMGLPVAGTGGFLSLPTGILTSSTTFYVQGYFVNPACAEFLNGKVRILVYPNPSVNIGPNITQCGGFGPLLDAGPGFSSYAWSNFQFTQTTIITSSGTYSVTVTDANGCQASDTMVYVFNPLPTPNLGPDRAICSGSSTVLNPGGGFSAYAWSTGASTSTLSVNSAGTYTVTVTDANGCTNSDQVAISLNALPTVNLGPDQSICGGASATFNAGPGFSAYAWSTGATTSTISPSTSGTYTVTVTDANGCTASDAAVLTVLANPTTTLGNDTAICTGSTLTLNAGAGFSGYAWSTGATTSTILVSTAGIFRVTVTDASGCTGTDQINVSLNPLPAVNLGPDVSICTGTSTLLQAGPGFSAYSWSTGATTSTISVNTAGTFTVTVTDANGCTNSDQIAVTLYAAPSVSLGPDQSICSGASANFNAGPAFSAYAWSTGATTSSISPSTSGTYTVTVTDGNGCTTSDAAVLTVLANPTTSLGNDTAICTGSSITLNAGAGFSGYLWTTGAATSTITVSTAGMYGVTVTDVNGCTGMSQINVSLNPLPTVNLGPDTSFCTGGNALLQAGPGFTAYNWSTGATTSSLAVVTGGTFTVTVTDANGCTASDSKTVTLLTSPTVFLGNDTTICPSDSVLLQATAGMSAYAWSTGATTQSIQAQAAGNYAVTITAANGCQGSDTLVLSHLAGPTVNLGPDTLLCPGGSTVLNAGNPGSNYLWNGGATTQTLTASTAGIFGVVVTDLNGCKGSDSVLVGFHVPPLVNLGPDTSICPGAAITFSVVGAFSSYAWNTGATTASITVGAAGSYDVTATDSNGCQASDTIVLTHFALPVVTLGNDTAICPLDSILLDAGAGQIGYLWNSGATTQTVQGQAAGAYQVTVTDANGCQAADTLVISHLPFPSVNLGSDTIACQGTTLTLDAGNPGNNFLWNTGATSQTISTSIAGSFSVTVTPALGCPIADTIAILFSPVPLPNLPASDTACTGDTLLLDPGAIVATYLWSTGATTQAILVSQGGPYAVTVTDTLGCTASDSMNVVLLAPPAVGIGPDSTICQGDSLLLSVPNAGLTFLWSTGSTSNAIFASSPGPYSVMAMDSFGCQSSDTMTLDLEAIPVVSLGGNRIICAGDSIPLDAGNPSLTYQWSNGATSQIVYASQPTTYAVTVSTTQGCTAADSMTLQLQPLPTVNIGADTTLCADDSLLLVNSTGFTGNWSNGSSNASIVATQSGWIWLQVFDNLGCSSRDSLLLTFQPMPVVSLSGLDPQYCLSDPAAQLIGQPSGGSFSGMASSSGLFTPSIAGTGNHLVIYSYTDTLGCPGSDSLSTNVVAPPSMADAGPDQYVNTQADLQAIAPSIGTGHWDIGAFPGQFSNPLSPNATAFLESNGSYPFVWITENAPCPTSMDTVWVQFEGMHIPTGFSPNGDGVNDEYVIRGIEGFPNTRLQVLNRWGQVLWQSDDYKNDWAGQGNNGAPLVEDTYYIIVRYGDQEVSTYVVLKR